MTGTGLAAAVLVLKALEVLLGGVVTAMALRAARRTGTRSFLLLAVGFGLVTVGAVVGMALYGGVGIDLRTAIAVQGIVLGAGFVTIAVSLYLVRRSHAGVRIVA